METAADLVDRIERARRGDRDAFASLCEIVGRPLFLYLAGLLRAREDVEDTLQTTLLRAWTGLPRLSRPDRFSPWIFRIARNAARDIGRRNRRRSEIEADEDLLGPAPPADQVGDDARRVVADLKPETRAVVLLRIVHGWTVEETAEAMQWSVAKTRRRYASALAVLRARIEREVTHDDRR